jgi:N-acetylmuramic acid 6-phosphate (MurNAc-6-P) etherase
MRSTEMDEKICGMTKESLRQCLSECGCCCKTADSVIEKIESSDRKGARKILEQKRKEALESLHQEQQKIDRIDFLSWQMDKEEKSGGKKE